MGVILIKVFVVVIISAAAQVSRTSHITFEKRILHSEEKGGGEGKSGWKEDTEKLLPYPFPFYVCSCSAS